MPGDLGRVLVAEPVSGWATGHRLSERHRCFASQCSACHPLPLAEQGSDVPCFHAHCPSTFTGPRRTSVPFRRKRPPGEHTHFNLASANDQDPPLFREAGRWTRRMTDGPHPWRALVGKGKPEREVRHGSAKEKASPPDETPGRGVFSGLLQLRTSPTYLHLLNQLGWNARTFSASLVPQAWPACYRAEAMVNPQKPAMTAPRHGPCPMVAASSSLQKRPVRSRSISLPTRSISGRISGRTGQGHRTGCGSAYSVYRIVCPCRT